MAYNNGFPMNYQQYYPQIPQQMIQQKTQMIEFIPVQTEEEARNFLVAPGASVNFINMNSPYVYTKTADASQFGSSKFEKYRLAKESDIHEESQPSVEYATKEEVEKMRERLDHLYNELEGGK